MIDNKPYEVGNNFRLASNQFENLIFYIVGANIVNRAILIKIEESTRIVLAESMFSKLNLDNYKDYLARMIYLRHIISNDTTKFINKFRSN